MGAKVKIVQTVEAICDNCGKAHSSSNTKTVKIKQYKQTFAGYLHYPKGWVYYNWSQHPVEMKEMVFCSALCRNKMATEVRRIIKQSKLEIGSLVKQRENALKKVIRKKK